MTNVRLWLCRVSLDSGAYGAVELKSEIDVAHQGETFIWQYLTFDVTRLTADIETGLIASVDVVVDGATIDGYSRKVLNLDGNSSTKVRLDMAYAERLEIGRLRESVLIVDLSDDGPVGDELEWNFDFSNAPHLDGQSNLTDELTAGIELKGVLEWDAPSRRLVPSAGERPANAIIIDGNHRIACAFVRRIDALPGKVARLCDLSRYLLD